MASWTKQSLGTSFREMIRIATGATRRLRANRFVLQDAAHWRRLYSLRLPYLLQSVADSATYSIVVPVYKTPLSWLSRCVESVRSQYLPTWQLVLVDDGSQDPALSAKLLEYAQQDSRILVHTRPKGGGIVAATNDGITLCQGEFVGFLDHDDDLTPDALLWLEIFRRRNPRTRWFYSDEAVIDGQGIVHCVHYKSDYSPEQLLSIMCTGHFSVFERKLLEDLGGLRAGFDGAQDHDLALRASEKVQPEEVAHIPYPLYIWRAMPGSTASNSKSKSWAADAGKKAASEAFARRGVQAELQPHEKFPTLYLASIKTEKTPRVSILIATKNRRDLLQPCVDSLRAATKYPNYEIVVINNQSDCASTLEYLRLGEAAGVFRVFDYDKPFNHSDMHNLAVAGLNSEFLLLLNNDVLNFSLNWLEEMIAAAQLDERIGAVGCKLLYEHGAIQHAGVVVGVGGLAGHAFCQQPVDTMGYFGRAHAPWNPTGVTAAMALFRMKAWRDAQGFDSDRFPTSYNDVDLCLRMKEAGYRCLYWPAASATHLEGGSRPVTPQEQEYRARLRDRWKTDAIRDPAWPQAVNVNTGEVMMSRHWLFDQLEALEGLERALVPVTRGRD